VVTTPLTCGVQASVAMAIRIVRMVHGRDDGDVTNWLQINDQALEISPHCHRIVIGLPHGNSTIATVAEPWSLPWRLR
jgi:hypothetical protein